MFKEACSFKIDKKNLVPGVNDLETVYPEICLEWDYSKNDDLPSDYSPFSMRKKWWLCRRGHSYQSTIANRTSGGNGCPECAKQYRSSFPEQTIRYYIKKYFPDAVNSDKTTVGYELDVLIPSKRIAVEYDGFFWHDGYEQRDTKKNNACNERGIMLIRVREKTLKHLDGCINITREDNYSDRSLEPVIRKIINVIDSSIEADINLERDRADIYSSFLHNERATSLASVAPELASEWHPTKNASLTPSMVSPNSHKRAWWICQEGHEWEAVIKNRYLGGTGCPICRRLYIKSNIKEVMCLETREVFESIASAGRAYDIPPNYISACITGLQKSVGGYHWALAKGGDVDPDDDIAEQLSLFDGIELL